MPGSNSRPNVSEGYEVPTELPGSTGLVQPVFAESELQATGKTLWCTADSTKSSKVTPKVSLKGLQVSSEGYTKTSYATLYKQWHRSMSKPFIKPPYSVSRATSIDWDCCRLPTASVFSKKADKAPLQSVLINESKFVKATRHTEMEKIEIPRSMLVEALSW